MKNISELNRELNRPGVENVQNIVQNILADSKFDSIEVTNRSPAYYSVGTFGAKLPMIGWDFSYVTHEIAHCIDFAMRDCITRLIENDYGFHIKTFQEINGERYYEPETTQITELEARVVGLQFHIEELCGLSVDVEHRSHCIKALDYLPDNCFIHKPSMIAQWIEESYANHSKDDILKYWNIVKEFFISHRK